MATISSTIKLVDNMSSTLTKIGKNVDTLKEKITGVSDAQKDVDNFSFTKFIEGAKSAADAAANIGRQMTLGLTLPIIKAGKDSYKAFTDQESAMAGVKKTVEPTKEEYIALQAALTEISETKPTSFVEAAGVMEMAGQMGVAKENLVAFTNAYIDLQNATNIAGEEGAKDLARFMNVTGESLDNTYRLGGVIVELGNNFATSEAEILAMATRMGATGDLAGFSATEILSLAAAFSSVGIEAEAGGSAAGKLMKKMQLAAEVGGSAQQKLADLGSQYESGLEFVNELAGMKKAEKLGLADQLGMTVDALENLGNSWLLLDQFSEVMGIDGSEFMSRWQKSPAQSMLDFFQGLAGLDPETGGSILSNLAEMGITEIRLSNLVAAMAGRPDLLQKTLALAAAQYGMEDPTGNALGVEAGTRYATTESQDKILANQWENTMAQFGDNVKKAIEPARDAVQGLLDAFNGLSEVDQQKIVNLLGAIAIGGPTLWILGRTVSLITKLASGLGTIAKLGGISKVLSGGAETAATEAATTTAAKTGLFSRIATSAGTKLATFGPWAATITMGILALKMMHDAQNEQARIAAEGEKQDYANLVSDTAKSGAQNIQDAYDTVMAVREKIRTTQGLTPEMIAEWTGTDAFQKAAEMAGFGGTDWVSMFSLGGWASLIGGTGRDTNAPLNQMLEELEWMAYDAAEAAGNVGNAAVESASETMSEGAGNTIGANLGQGVVNGIQSKVASAAMAAAALARAVINAANAEAGIHSPSRETFWSGEMLVQGYVDALNRRGGNVSKAAVRVMRNTTRAIRNSSWDNIDYFAGLEQAQLADEDSEIKVSDADIQKIRSLAEREAINKFTTAQIHVDFGGVTNNVSKNTDLDEMLSYIEDKVTERLEAAAEGVYT